jgi:hypothetical protein
MNFDSRRDKHPLERTHQTTEWLSEMGIVFDEKHDPVILTMSEPRGNARAVTLAMIAANIVLAGYLWFAYAYS